MQLFHRGFVLGNVTAIGQHKKRVVLRSGGSFGSFSRGSFFSFEACEFFLIGFGDLKIGLCGCQIGFGLRDLVVLCGQFAFQFSNACGFVLGQLGFFSLSASSSS